jgi:hypothetical protein
MAELENKNKVKANNNGNGHKPDGDMDESVKKYLEEKEKSEVPHAYHQLYHRTEENEMDEISDLNDREIVFMAVNQIRDDALDPERVYSISTLLRRHIKILKISRGREGRKEAVLVNQMTQEEAAAQSGSKMMD